jgi:predicted transcriptional regulator
MGQEPLDRTSRRERQILEFLFRAGQGTAAQVREAMPDPPSYSAVRATLRILEDKGLVSHEDREGTYLYSPTVPREKARRSAVRSLIDTFFEGSPVDAAVALLGSSKARFSPQDLERLSEIVEKAKREGKS